MRVVDTPIAEQAIVGLGLGAAAVGLRPIVDLMFMDFVMVAMDQIANQAAKMKYMFGGKAKVPLTITTTAGAGLGAAAQHSASLEAWLIHVPGLKVVYPSNAHDLKGLLVSCVRDDNPTIVTLHKAMLGSRGHHVPEGLYEIPLGKANIVREGSDATVVAIGRMVGSPSRRPPPSPRRASTSRSSTPDPAALRHRDGRRVGPQDQPGRGRPRGGQERWHRCRDRGADPGGGLRLPRCAGRSGRAPFSPVPFSPALEREYVPDADDIAAAVRATLQPLIA